VIEVKGNEVLFKTNLIFKAKISCTKLGTDYSCIAEINLHGKDDTSCVFIILLLVFSPAVLFGLLYLYFKKKS